MQALISYSRIIVALLCVLGVLADLVARVELNHFHIVHEAVLYSLLSVPESAARFVFALECALVAIIALIQARRLWKQPNVTSATDLSARGRLFVALLFLVLAGAVALTLGNPIASIGLLPPGSGGTRALILDIDPWVRRWIEPGYLALVFAALVIRVTSVDGRCDERWRAVMSSMVLLITLESVLLHPLVVDARELLGYSFLPIIHYLLTQLFLLCWIEFLVSSFTSLNHGFRQEVISWSWLFWAVISLGVGSVIVCFVSAQRLAKSATIQVGAHYYSWFPENWGHGYIGEKIVPPYTSELGEYRSDSSRVLAHHIARAGEAGVTFFVFDWWPERPTIGRRLRKNIPKVNWGNFQFAVLYETLDLKTKAASPVPYEDQNAVVLTRERTAAMQMHWEHIVKRFAYHPSYLRVGTKPVVFMYATRHILGEISRRISLARLHVRATTGTELFLVADEAFFNVLSNGRTKAIMRPEGDPEWNRIIAFDAVTAYNPYDSTRTEHAGEGGARRFMSDVLGIYTRYRAIAATAGERFIPAVLPGYNDRGVRLGANHYVVPRTFDDGSTFFSKMLRQVGLPLMDRFFPLIAVTSWNEWNEGTNIEPSIVTDPSLKDVSEGGGFFTQGELHHGAGCEEVDELSSVLGEWNKKLTK